MESVVPKVRALPMSDEKLAVGQTDIIIICWKSDGKNLVRKLSYIIQFKCNFNQNENDINMM